MPSRVLMPEYPAPYGLAALTTLGRILEYRDFETTDIGEWLVVNETEVDQQRAWHPGWNLPAHAPEGHLACIDAYLFL